MFWTSRILLDIMSFWVWAGLFILDSRGADPGGCDPGEALVRGTGIRGARGAEAARSAAVVTQGAGY